MNSFNITELLVITPLIALFLGSIIPISVKAFRGKEMSPFASLFAAIVSIVAAAGLNITLVGGFWKLSGLNFMTAFAGALVVDGISVWSAYIIYIITGFVLMLLYENKATKGPQLAEQIFLVMSAAMGMVLVTMANNLIVLFIVIELMSLSLYLLIALSREGVFSREASFKYFVLGSVGSAILLYGMAFIYGSTGSTVLQELGANAGSLFMSDKLFAIGVALFIAGMAFKVALVPFHSWAPDVYQGSATPVTTFMATGVKLASFVAFLRLFIYSEAIETESIALLLQWITVLTMIGGSIAALRQENLKRMLAYSSIAHSGYAMMGFLSAVFGVDSTDGTTGLLFYLLVYSLMTIGSFAVISVLEAKEDTILLVDDLKGLAKRQPMLAFVFAVILLSLAGIPPTVGFFGKLYLIMTVLDQGFVWVAIMAMVSSAIGVYFYLRPIVVMYMSEGSITPINKNSYLTQSVALVMAIAMVVLGVLASPLYMFVKNSVFRSL
jgi:NADH-quinone oxidoreductase subunit N